MLIPDDIRKCVAFVGLQMANGEFRLCGSVFFLGRDKPGQSAASPMYAVTAKHVIEKIRAMGTDQVWLRLNLKSGEARWFNTSLNDWFSHPKDRSIDVAILETGLDISFDHLVYPYSRCVTDEVMRENQVGLGDEVFITGLFRHHHGSRRNIPIVRVGNLACMTEEKVSTKYLGEIDAYLVEARSIGGLSGSPVFLNLGITRVIEKSVRFAQGETIYYLLGLVHGHYDEREDEADGVELPGAEGKVNTGIAVVVPFHSIDAVIVEFERAKT
jgi:hypothetical protein